MKPLSASHKLTLYFKSTQRSKKGLLSIERVLMLSLPTIEGFLSREMKFYRKGVNRVEFNLVLCGETKIQQLNYQYRNKEKVTDVLSFPIHEDLRNLDYWEGPLAIGDVFICRDVALKQAKEFQITYPQEIAHLFVHGILHLLGYDHEKGGKEEELMFGWESKLVKKIYNSIYGEN